MTAFSDDDGMIDLWTSEFLREFDCRSKSTVDPTSKSHVAFGRTTHENERLESNIRIGLTRPHTVPILLPSYTNGQNNRISFQQPTKLSDSRIQLTNDFLNRISGLQSKVRGSQMLNFKLDLSKAREKRKRQLQFSREIQSGAKTLHSREIDSVTRIVVQSFRKLIDCERCALFLMDASTDELYFKPVDDIEYSHARLKDVRFPASSGVAGWVASNKKMLNIKNAYHDSRFNADIDKKTGFRTRTILCHPVLSSTNHLLGVIQMVNKKRSNPKELRDKAKKRGYQSSFEHFSEKDEQILGKCCSEVSKSLEDIFARQHRRLVESEVGEGSLKAICGDEVVAGDLEKELTSPLGNSCIDDMSNEARKDGSIDQSLTTDFHSSSSEPHRRPSSRRQSSIGYLSTNINGIANNINGLDVDANDVGMSEATRQMQFRDRNSEILQQREMERRNSDAEYLLAKAKRDRMMEYGHQLREAINDESAEHSTCSPEPQRQDLTRRRSSIGQRRRSSVGEFPLLMNGFNGASSFQGMGISEAIQKLHYRDQNSAKLQQREMERRNSDAEYLLALNKRNRMLEYGVQLREPRNDEIVEQMSTANNTNSSDSRYRGSITRSLSIGERRHSSVGGFTHLLPGGNTASGETESAFHGMGISEAIQKLHYRDQNSEKLQQREMERRNCDAEYLLAQAKRVRMMEYGHQLREPRNDESLEQFSSADSTSCSKERRNFVGKRRRSSLCNPLFQCNNGCDAGSCEVETAFQGMGITEAIQKFHFRDQNSEKLQKRETERRNSDAEYLLALSKRERMHNYGRLLRESKNDDYVDQLSTVDGTTSSEPRLRNCRGRRSSAGERTAVGFDVEAAFEGMGITEAIQKLHIRNQNSDKLQQREMERRNSDASSCLFASNRER